MNDSLSKIASVWIGTLITWLFTLTNILDFVSILVGLSAFGYTIWRWIRDVKKEKNLNKKNKEN